MADNRLGYNQRPATRGPGLLNRITGVAGALVGLFILSAVLVFGLMVSVVVLPVVLLLAAVAMGYFWFKTRGLRKDFKAQMQAFRETHPRFRSGSNSVPSAREQENVIDGDDYIHEAAPQNRPDKNNP